MSLYKMLFEDPNTKKYTAIGGSIVIVIAMAGIFMHEAGAYKTINLEDIFIGGFGTEKYKIDWVTHDSGIEAIPGYNDVTLNYDLTHYNLTEVTFTLKWTDDEPISVVGYLADELTLTVSHPDFEQRTQSSTSGEIPIPFPINTKPEPIENLSSGEKDEELEKNPNVAGTGEWTITIEVNAVGGTFRTGLDNGNDWNLEIIYSWYEPKTSEMEDE